MSVTLEQIFITLRFLYLASSKFNIYSNTRGIILYFYDIICMRLVNNSSVLFMWKIYMKVSQNKLYI